MRRGAVADLLPVLAVEEGHFITVDGRIGAALACTGINLAIQSDEAAATIAALFAETLNYLPLGAHLELLVVNSPLRADEWVPWHRAQYAPPVGLDTYVTHLAAAYRRELGEQHIPDLRFSAILSLPGVGEGHRARRPHPDRRRLLARGRVAHREALAALTQATSELSHALAELEIVATPLGRQGMLDLLWQCANPTWSQDVIAPYRAASPTDLRTLRDRLGQSRLLRRADSLSLDRGYETTMALRALPDGTFPGWLRSLMATGVAFRFALHIEPLAKEKERTVLTRTLRQRHAVLAERQHQGSSPISSRRRPTARRRTSCARWRRPTCAPSAPPSSSPSAPTPRAMSPPQPARSARRSATRAARRLIAATSIKTLCGGRPCRSPIIRRG